MARLLVFRVHALRRMFERSVTVSEVAEIVQRGETIARYPRDRPYPSRLVLGWSGGRALHLVAADDPDGDLTIVITVYQPDPAIWLPDFRSRR